MTRPTPYQKCPYSPHLGPVGCLPAPNIFHLANEFAKGKMFWNLRPISLTISSSNLTNDIFQSETSLDESPYLGVGWRDEVFLVSFAKFLLKLLFCKVSILVFMLFRQVSFFVNPIFQNQFFVKFHFSKFLFTRESRCLAGEPKHFPFAIVFV